MSSGASSTSWREIGATAVLLFAIAFVGCAAAFALWLQDIGSPQIAILGSGNRLSLLVMDGSARLIIATGDDPIAYENALTQVRPLFARRVDVLLVAGSGSTLLVPLTAHGDRHVRTTTALASLPQSPEAAELGAVSAFSAPRRIRLGPTIDVIVETAFPFGADPTTEFPAWRATIAHRDTRIVMYSDGAAAGLFPPDEPASVLVVSGADPAAAWTLTPAVAMIANAETITGPELRDAFALSPRPPEWGFRVHPNEALRLRFIPGGVEIPAASAQDLNGGDRVIG